MTGASAAGLAQRLIDEGLRIADHPGVIIKEGPSGRRAALAYGPDVWEVIKFLREVENDRSGLMITWLLRAGTAR